MQFLYNTQNYSHFRKWKKKGYFAESHNFVILMKYKQLPSFSNPLLKGGWVHSAEISLTLIARLMTLIRAGRKKLFFVTCRETSLSHFSRTSLVQKIKIGKEVFNGYWFPPPTPLGGKHLSPESLFLQQARQFFFPAVFIKRQVSQVAELLSILRPRETPSEPLGRIECDRWQMTSLDVCRRITGVKESPAITDWLAIMKLESLAKKKSLRSLPWQKNLRVTLDLPNNYKEEAETAMLSISVTNYIAFRAKVLSCLLFFSFLLLPLSLFSIWLTVCVAWPLQRFDRDRQPNTLPQKEKLK